jgi:predicted  nucleic acid-binding Zn-ribbon protein
MAVETSLALQQLHHVLQQLGDAEALLAHGPKRIAAAKKKIATAAEICADQKEQIKTIRKTSDQKSLTLKSHEADLLKQTQRLNEASSNKEYDIVQGQLGTIRSAKDSLEDEILALLTNVDEAADVLATAENEVMQLTARCREIEAEVEAKEPGILEDVERFHGAIAEAESAIPAGESRGKYERLRASMKSGALSEVQDAFCLACNTKVIAQDCVRIKIGEFVSCRQCGRILYIAE